MICHYWILAKTAALLLLISSVSAANDFIAVTGLTNGVNSATGARPVRQNINSFAGSGAAWDLYIQALAAFQASGQSNTLSYYQIAGIHGKPYAAWNNVTGPMGIHYATGYCTHGSILFPVWHRPYLALYETTLYSYVKNIASTYRQSNAAQYQQAAQTWRMPYWDWASTPQMPASVTSPTLRITGPSGPLTVANPLFNYTFHPLSTTDFPPSSRDAPQSIIRAPSTYRDANSNGVSNEDYVNQQLQSAGLKSAVYDVFTQDTTYANVATQVNSGSSLESVHGTVHVTVGQGNGHMTYIPYSAFDPIFFLHHTNVDRLFAMWQAIYPNQYVTAQVNNYGTYTESGGTREDQNTNLTPFTSNTAGTTFWTSTTSRQLKSWGYTYPEIQDWNQTPAQLQANVRQSVNRLYSPGTTNSRRRNGRTSRRDIDSELSGALSMLEPTTTQWYASVSVDNFCVGGPFKLFMFIGPPPSDPTAWGTAMNLVGVQGFFAPVADVGTLPPQIVHSRINLMKSFTLPAYGLLNTVAKVATPFLTKSLQWGVQKADGTVVPNSEIPSLKIDVQETEVTPPKDATSFPTYGNFIKHPEIMSGKLYNKD